MLAPMENISDNAFRTICFRYGAELTFTEIVRLEGLARKNASTWGRLSFNDKTPVVIQILGSKEYNLKKFLSMFSPSEGFKGFNLNLGCPSPNILNIGQGCAMVKRIIKTKKLVDVIKKRGFQCSIKMRLGMNKFEKDKKVYLNLIKNVDADFFIVHARYGSQTYREPADFSVYDECVNTGKDIIANGDITTKEQVELLKSTGVKGVMIGRAAVVNPSIFNVLKGSKEEYLEKIKKEYLELAQRFNAPFRYRDNFLKHVGKGSLSLEFNHAKM